MALRFDGSEWWDRGIANFYEGDSADGSGGSSTGGADSGAGASDGTGSESESDSFSGASIADPSGQYGGVQGIDTETGSVSMDFGYDPGTSPGTTTEADPPGYDGVGLGGGSASTPEQGFSISSFAMNARRSLGPLFGALSFAAKTAMNPLGLIARVPAVKLAPNLQPGMIDRAKALADKQNAWGGTGSTGGSIVGGLTGYGPVGTAFGGMLAGIGGQMAAGLTDKTAMGMTTGPMGYQDPQAVAEFSGMTSAAQPGGLNAGGDENVITAMARRAAGMPAISSQYPQPAITTPQARAVYQNR